LLNQWELGDGSDSLGGDSLNLLLEGLDGLFLLLDGLTAGEIGNFFSDSGNGLLEGLN
jgi:hypothetical protein